MTNELDNTKARLKVLEEDKAKNDAERNEYKSEISRLRQERQQQQEQWHGLSPDLSQIAAVVRSIQNKVQAGTRSAV